MLKLLKRAICYERMDGPTLIIENGCIKKRTTYFKNLVNGRHYSVLLLKSGKVLGYSKHFILHMPPPRKYAHIYTLSSNIYTLKHKKYLGYI